MRAELTGQVVVVTGAVRGIGAATAALAAASEARALLLTDRDGEACRAVERRLAAEGTMVASVYAWRPLPSRERSWRPSGASNGPLGGAGSRRGRLRARRGRRQPAASSFMVKPVPSALISASTAWPSWAPSNS